MTEYITKDQAYLCMLENWDGDMLPGDYDDLLREIPSADVVEIVRCKDCKHAEKTYKPDVIRCANFSTYHNPWKVWRGWYCGDGERKDGR